MLPQPPSHRVLGTGGPEGRRGHTLRSCLCVRDTCVLSPQSVRRRLGRADTVGPPGAVPQHQPPHPAGAP